MQSTAGTQRNSAPRGMDPSGREALGTGCPPCARGLAVFCQNSRCAASTQKGAMLKVDAVSLLGECVELPRVPNGTTVKPGRHKRERALRRDYQSGFSVSAKWDGGGNDT